MSVSKRVTRWYCEHGCGRGFWKREQADRHETHCFRRDDRVPWPGELSSIKATGRRDWAEYGHWESHTPPVWWPGPGKLWTGTEWADVPGYSSAPNDSGAGPEDVWPACLGPFYEGRPLNELPGEIRLDWWRRQTEPEAHVGVVTALPES